MTLLECNYLIFTNLSVIFIHFVIISKYLGKKLQLFTLFSITRHCFSLFLVGSKSMLALLPFKVTITPRHWNDKCFHRAAGDLICRFCICASHFQCTVGAQQEILCLTVHTTWLMWRVWPRSLGMSVPAWQRHREVEQIEKFAMKTQHLVASTPFVHNSVSHDHIVVPFMTFLADLTVLAVMNRIFHSKMAVTARAGGACTQFKTKHQSKLQRVLPAYMAFHKIAG